MPISLKIIDDKLEAWWQQLLPQTAVIRIDEPTIASGRLRIPATSVWVFDPRHITVLNENFDEIQGVGEVVRVYASDNSTLLSEFTPNTDPQPAVDLNGGGVLNNPGSTEFGDNVYVEVSGAFPAAQPAPPFYQSMIVLCGRGVARKAIAKGQDLQVIQEVQRTSARVMDVIQDLKGTSTWDLDMGPDMYSPTVPNDYFTLAGMGVRVDLLERFFGLSISGHDEVTRFADNVDPLTWPIPDLPADQRQPGHHSRHRVGKYTSWPGGETGQRHTTTIPGSVIHAAGTYGFDPIVHADQHQFDEAGAPADPIFINSLAGKLFDNWAHNELASANFTDVNRSLLHHLATPSVLGVGGFAGFMGPQILETVTNVTTGNITEFGFNCTRAADPGAMVPPSTDPEDGFPILILQNTALQAAALIKIREFDAGHPTYPSAKEFEIRVSNTIEVDANTSAHKITAWRTYRFFGFAGGTQFEAAAALIKSLKSEIVDVDPAVGTFNNARYRANVSAATTGDRSLILEGYHGTATRGKLRIYAGFAGIEITYNARWDVADSLWHRDTATNLEASMYRLGQYPETYQETTGVASWQDDNSSSGWEHFVQFSRGRNKAYGRAHGQDGYWSGGMHVDTNLKLLVPVSFPIPHADDVPAAITIIVETSYNLAVSPPVPVLASEYGFSVALEKGAGTSGLEYGFCYARGHYLAQW